MTQSTPLLAVLFTGCLLPAACPANLAAQNLPADREDIRRLDSYLERAAAFGFSGAVLIMHGDETVMSEGYGYAERSAGVRFSPGTAFDVGSVAKQFTAAAVLQLEAAGRLHTGDTIDRHLDDVPAGKSAITIHQLLTHTSGLTRDWSSFEAEAGVDELTRGILSTELHTDPGERFFYSNIGYKLLAAIVERASDTPFRDYLRTRLFEPLGMRNTGFYGDDLWDSGGVAHSYFETVDMGDPSDWTRTWNALGNGHVISTIEDLGRWESALRAGQMPAVDMLETMFTPHVNTGGGERYGYGWFVGATETGTSLVHHGGDYRGFSVDYRRYPDDDVAIILASNVGYVGGLGMRRAVAEPVQSIVFGRGDVSMPPEPRPVDGEELDALYGMYRLSEDGSLHIYLRDEAIMIEPSGQEAFDLIYQPPLERRKRYAALNRQADTLMRTVYAHDLDIQDQNSSDPGPLAALVGSYTWTYLHEQFGEYLDHEILGTAPYPFSDRMERTFIRLIHADGEAIVTLGYRDDEFFDLSTWDGVPNPSAVPFVPTETAEDQMRTFSVWNTWKRNGVMARHREQSLEFLTADGPIAIRASETDHVFYYLDHSCHCSPSANLPEGDYWFISSDISTVTSEEMKKVVLRYRRFLLDRFDEYAPLARDIVLRYQPDRASASASREAKIEKMRERGYEILEVEFSEADGPG